MGGVRERSSESLRSGGLCPLFVFGVGLQHEVANAILCVLVDDGTKQREAATITVDDVLSAPGT